MHSFWRHAALLIPLVLAAPACSGGSGGGDDDDNETPTASPDGGNNGGEALAMGEGPCVEPSDCETGMCLEINDESYCSDECDNSACPSGFSCDAELFGAFGIEICIMNDEQTGQPPEAEEPPSLPCSTDADCSDGLICGTWNGYSECTLECAEEDDCSWSDGFYTYDFFQCTSDEGDSSRSICAPDPACWTNPFACIGGF